MKSIVEVPFGSTERSATPAQMIEFWARSRRISDLAHGVELLSDSDCAHMLPLNDLMRRLVLDIEQLREVMRPIHDGTVAAMQERK